MELTDLLLLDLELIVLGDGDVEGCREVVKVGWVGAYGCKEEAMS